VVTGAEDYVVQIEVASRDLAGSCTCPFAEDGFFCKHMVATVLRWAEAGTEDEAHDSDAFQQENDGESAPESDEEERLRGFLAEQPLGWLVDELLDAADRDPLLRARLLVGAGVPAEAAFEETSMRQALANAFSVDGFVSYRGSRSPRPSAAPMASWRCCGTVPREASTIWASRECCTARGAARRRSNG